MLDLPPSTGRSSGPSLVSLHPARRSTLLCPQLTGLNPHPVCSRVQSYLLFRVHYLHVTENGDHDPLWQRALCLERLGHDEQHGGRPDGAPGVRHVEGVIPGHGVSTGAGSAPLPGEARHLVPLLNGPAQPVAQTLAPAPRHLGALLTHII